MLAAERRYYENNMISNILNKIGIHHLTIGKSCALHMGRTRNSITLCAYLVCGMQAVLEEHCRF